MDKPLTMIFALIITIAIFSLGLSLNYLMDNQRINDLSKSLREQEINFYSTLLKDELTTNFGYVDCYSMENDINLYEQSIASLGNSIVAYNSKSFFRKQEFDFLKSTYFYTKLKLYLYVTEYNSLCRTFYKPIIFFYREEKEDDTIQGYILTEYSKNKEDIIVFSFDMDYDKNVFLESLKLRHNITETPALIYNGTAYKITIYEAELNEIIK
jgi:hypothetical protein